MKTIKNFFIYWAYFIYYYLDIKNNISKYKNVSADIVLEYKVRMFVLLAHHKVRQKYDKKYPYYYHLNMVANFALKFLNPCRMTNINPVLVALLHDIIEDVHSFTYNDIKKLFGEEIVEGVFACTELRGRNRDERHGPEYYKLLQENELGAYVKICDVIANMTMGKRTGNSMFEKYKKEYPKFKELLFEYKFQPLFNHIEDSIINPIFKPIIK